MRMQDKATPYEFEAFKNKFAVILKEGQLFMPVKLPETLTKRDGLVLAAWIVRLCDQRGGEDFAQMLRMVRGLSTS